MLKSLSIASFIIVLTSNAAFAQARPSTSTSSPRQSASAFPEVRRLQGPISEIVKRDARNNIERSIGSKTNTYGVSSRDRPQNSPIASRAHDRGAVDFVPSSHSSITRMQNDARSASQRLGPGYTAIVEQPKRAPVGPSADIHTSYRNGSFVRESAQPPRATGNHIHIQPDFGVPPPPSTVNRPYFR
jgi:hypothetical protein